MEDLFSIKGNSKYIDNKPKKPELEKLLNLDISYTKRTPKDFSKRNLTPDFFRESPSSSNLEHRMDDLSSFAVLGVDIKITPTGEVKIIEINGLNSGMNGFIEAKVEFDGTNNPTVNDLRRMFPFDLDNEELWGYIKKGILDRNSCDDALRRHISRLGDAPVAYISAVLKEAGISNYRIAGAEAVFGEDDPYAIIPTLSRSIRKLTVHPIWEIQYGDIAKTLICIEKILEDKLRTDKLFDDDCRDIKPKSYEYTEEEYQKLLENEQLKHVVLKPSNGARGEGLRIIEASTPQKERPADFNDIAEPFVPSKPIKSSQDGQYHDGCMRYILFVEENKNGKISIHHFGGYWRLAPEPLSEEGKIDAMRANLSQGALAEKVSDEDLEFVRNILNEKIPIFYNNLLEQASPKRRFQTLEKEIRKYS